MELQFEIKNFACAYRHGQEVLQVRDLPVPRGQLMFILGISGIDKSTFIESLGLMNDIIVPKPDTSVRFFAQNGEISEMTGLWRGNNRLISHFRNRYFSFIFQNTNLMPHFSAGENMCTSQLISGRTLAQAKPVVQHIMQALNLPPDVFDKKITELSGGQRQRLAFVRAITAEFEVLFGDEPTGNLDRDTGVRLMQVLKQNLTDHRRTGIIVSHDIELALLFADRILLLTPRVNPENESVCGTVEEDNCLTRTSDGKWATATGRPIGHPHEYITQILGIQIPRADAQ